MKKYILFLALSSTILGTNSCSGDFLDKTPELETTEPDVFSTKAKIERNLLGLYGSAKEIIALRGHAFIAARGDDFINLSVNTNEASASYEMSVGMATIDNTDTWTGLYAAINNVNTFISNLESNKEIVGEDYDQYIAEAKFVRALSYYYLNNLYAQPYLLDANAKSVPLRLKAENSIKNNDLARARTPEVYQQIFEDLSDENITALPNTANDYSTITRATKDAVRMLRMRCYMEQGLWDKAIDEGKNIVSYSLSSDISSIFRSPYMTNEVIFSFPMADTNRGERQTAFAYYLYDGSRFVIDSQTGIYSKPYYSLPIDQRVEKLTSKANGQGVSTKFNDYQTYLDWIPVFRFAETKLNLSECYYNVGREDDAKVVLKEVRNRSIVPAEDPLNIDILSGEELFKAIDNERRTEFFGEAIRSLDIHRRGETYRKQEGTPQSITITPTTSGYIWPIPTTERIINNLIED